MVILHLCIVSINHMGTCIASSCGVGNWVLKALMPKLCNHVEYVNIFFIVELVNLTFMMVWSSLSSTEPGNYYYTSGMHDTVGVSLLVHMQHVTQPQAAEFQHGVGLHYSDVRPLYFTTTSGPRGMFENVGQAWGWNGWGCTHTHSWS